MQLQESESYAVRNFSGIVFWVCFVMCVGCFAVFCNCFLAVAAEDAELDSLLSRSKITQHLVIISWVYPRWVTPHCLAAPKFPTRFIGTNRLESRHRGEGASSESFIGSNKHGGFFQRREIHHTPVVTTN